MKLEQFNLELKDDQEIVAEIPTEKKLVGSKRYIRGLTVWEINLKSMMLTRATINKTVADMDGEEHHQILMNDNCVYVQAINRSNAARKAIKLAMKNLLVPMPK